MTSTYAEAIAIEKTISLLAASTVLWARAGVDNAEDAAEFIYPPFMGPDVTGSGIAWPVLCLETPVGGLVWSRTSRGARDGFNPSGTLILEIYDISRFPRESIKEAYYDFLDFSSGVVQALVDGSGYDSNISYESIEKAMPALPPDPNSSDDDQYFVTSYSLNWRR